ncbi:bifunctional UDP-N-acetylmuramoyl-L-alanyl-D-glutamate--2,6-diaminopimelate ligase MurE/UDP-N-acetylmuramoyl-tripeptide--D-alanyl-D-alanine ligase MurF [Desulfotalea psychrophila]|uniref:bifunctional UDP-N-acetylmuramoyl-L-alanyl-D-glutamate--2, 6-diaminopimelate ligase MurE/UDP-N-acetylmuramoyl-tripeptide--D-alanyl-D-alanine ligase MurF n=1 Tax=Desulfotalea psychrophila TaxID=84980 RepID=UPI00059D5553|nr:bifunctional UDP-N-acetylmuramoyl-L-alanyl-D-glutamate--2,6-diaminopimelate ligase MurE/UDP-N-acetylmuramoyl-tripeptide--D-alanyl-D-alanine ligase MurF [Desulfotalea psychrophila]
MEGNCVLEKLLEGLEWLQLPSRSELDPQTHLVADVTADSRQVASGSLFIARRGGIQDGHAYVEDALLRGCPVVIVEAGSVSQNAYAHCPALVIEVADSQAAYGKILANYFANPAEKLSLVGITGTNGKTTISYLLEDMLTRLGHQVGVIGTVNNRFYRADGSQEIIATSLTTPDAKIVQQLLRRMADAGVDTVIMEVSSHAISQARIGALRFDLAIFTNLSRDHLDYHLQMEDYFSAKLGLFSRYLKEDGIAVIPSDSRQLQTEFLQRLHRQLAGRNRFLSWGEEVGSDVQLHHYRVGLTETDCAVRLADCQQMLEFQSGLVGRFNIDNLLAVIAACRALAISGQDIAENIGRLQGAPGRVERVFATETPANAQPVVFVDYAHTPDALDKLLSTLGDVPHGDLIAVFGCGGDRDKGKRPLMGAVAARLADVVIVADDNPRTEASEPILAEIVVGVAEQAMPLRNPDWLFERKANERGCVVVGDRRRAIDLAVHMACSKDIIAIAGKGHEPYQLGATGKKFFDDRLQAGRALASWTPDKLVAATGGSLIGGMLTPLLLGEVTTDSRSVGRGSIFVALRGENHDGHAYLDQVVAAGAACLVVEKARPDLTCPQVLVADTRRALGDMAAARRCAFAGTTKPVVVGITGSSGKTTIKEMTASILASLWPAGAEYPENVVLKTEGNFNNLIGLPLSLLPLDNMHRAAVLEMGMNSPGEIARLAEIAQPDICCVANVHAAHLSGLGSIEGVARAKEELFAHAPVDSILVVNLDDPHVVEMAKGYEQKKICYSLSAAGSADIWASDLSSGEAGSIDFNLHLGAESTSVQLDTLGEHNVSNALAAAGIALAAGASPQQIALGLGSYKTPSKRLERIRTSCNWTIISDCYNANPASMSAGLRTLATVAGEKKIAIVGDMLELGEFAEEAHRQIGSLAGELSLDYLLIVGEFASFLQQAALNSGMGKEQVLVFPSKEAIIDWLQAYQADGGLGEKDIVFIKGSRGMQLETLIPPFV